MPDDTPGATGGSLGLLNTTEREKLRGVGYRSQPRGAGRPTIPKERRTKHYHRTGIDETNTIHANLSDQTGESQTRCRGSTDLLGRISCSSLVHRSTKGTIPSRGKDNSSGVTTTRTLSNQPGGPIPITRPSGNQTWWNVEIHLPVHQSHTRKSAEHGCPGIP